MKPGDLDRIREALEAAGRVLEKFTPGKIAADKKAGGDPVTAADLAVDDVLRKILPRSGEGWLSEETADRPDRLQASRVWVVDPVDGTKEFVAGIPEWCVSVGLVDNGEAVAGGIYTPAADRMILGSLETGVTLNGEPARVRDRSELAGAEVLASRSEVNRGEWEIHAAAAFSVVPMGSVANKLSLLAAGLTDATWTVVPKHEWDIAAGVALVHAAGGETRTLDWQRPRFNTESAHLKGLVASGPGLLGEIGRLLGLDPAGL
jgi:myo-inositol-1(or 4)-monophosphatase